MRTMLLASSTGTSSHPGNKIQRRKLSFSNVLLLHSLILPGVLLSSLKIINPWLSACDITHPYEPEFQGACSAIPRQTHKKMQQVGEMFSCPNACPLKGPSLDPHCLPYLDENRKRSICNFSPTTGKAWLKRLLAKIHLRHCCEHNVLESLSGNLLERVLKGKEDCNGIIDNLVDLDNLAARIICEFNEVLSRFDCTHSYSVRFACEDCKAAYRRWVCSSMVPYFNGTKRIRPCRSACEIVEQKCPYFLPENRSPALLTQYAGEPAFLCMDPNIPESGMQKAKSIYPEENSCCTKPCGLPYEGICLIQGTNCDPPPYDNETMEECTDVDPILLRTGSERCAGPSVFPGSNSPSLSPSTLHPFFIILSVFLILQASHCNCYHQFLLVLALVFALYSSTIGILQILTFCCFFSFPLPIGFVTKAYYYLIKILKLISDYFEYYFNLISAKLRAGRDLFQRAPRTPTPPQVGE